MQDRHLNIWYGYNSDNTLIENNLTRAFVLTLRLLTPDTRGRLLQAVFSGKPEESPCYGDLPSSFADASFALQGHMDLQFSRGARSKHILVLGSALPRLTDEEWTPYLSVPDAWIFSEQSGYCILVESKLGDGALGEGQLRSHAARWMGLGTAEAVRNHTITIGWSDLAEHVDSLRPEGARAVGPVTAQDDLLLAALLELLSFYGYRRFCGLSLAALRGPPRAIWGGRRRRCFSTLGLLRVPPLFALGSPR